VLQVLERLELRFKKMKTKAIVVAIVVAMLVMLPVYEASSY
jgi:hypothetical protein